jgi:FkbM family methyltransferase
VRRRIRELVFAPLRAVRAALARIAAALVARVPTLEPWFVRTGRALARRSRFGGGLYWLAQDALMKRLRRTGHRYRSVTVRDYVVDVDVTDASGRLSYFYSKPYRKAVVDAMITALKPGDVFLDVGAHLGYFSMVAARVVGPTGRVIAFEPHERMQSELRAIVTRNAVERIVEIVPLAVADRESDCTLYTSDGSEAQTTIDPERSPVRGTATFRPATVVRTTSLDQWLAARPTLASRVRCIKIDVQGAESRVVAGMGRTLLPGVTVLCDTSIGSEADLTLERVGYRRHRIERGAAVYGNFLYVRPGPVPF